MLSRTLSVLAFTIMILAAAGCSKNSEVRSGMLGESQRESRNATDEDGDVQVTLADCPAAVQATILKQVGTGTINEIERTSAGNYEVDARGSDGQFEFVVAANGTYMGPEADDDDDHDGDNGDDDDDDDDDND